jgi:hypothetical protein
MATYDPSPFPRRAKNPSLLNELRYQAQLLHFRYEINTGLYVMSPGEKLAFNLFFLGLATLLLYAVYYCLPLSVVRNLHKAVGSVGSSVKGSVYRMEVRTTIVQGGVAGEHVASLLPGYTGANASMVSVPGF